MKTAFLRMPQYLSVDYLSGGETDVAAPDLQHRYGRAAAGHPEGEGEPPADLRHLGRPQAHSHLEQEGRLGGDWWATQERYYLQDKVF